MKIMAYYGIIIILWALFLGYGEVEQSIIGLNIIIMLLYFILAEIIKLKEK